jgi:hypothetical protein
VQWGNFLVSRRRLGGDSSRSRIGSRQLRQVAEDDRFCEPASMVSLARFYRGDRYSTPSGTYTASSMNEIWYSKQWDNAPMPHAVFFTKEGHAIHGTNEVRRLGRPASHGCVRLSPQNAATLYAIVGENGLENTQVVLVGLTPGGEAKVARHGGGKVKSAVRSKPRYRTELYFEPQRRGGLFGRRWWRRR